MAFGFPAIKTMIAQEKMDRFDIVVCCPHLTYDVKKMVKNANPDKPIYILPPRMYARIANSRHATREQMIEGSGAFLIQFEKK